MHRPNSTLGIAAGPAAAAAAAAAALFFLLIGLQRLSNSSTTVGGSAQPSPERPSHLSGLGAKGAGAGCLLEAGR